MGEEDAGSEVPDTGCSDEEGTPAFPRMTWMAWEFTLGQLRVEVLWICPGVD